MSDRRADTGAREPQRRIRKLAEYDVPKLVAEVRAGIPAYEVCEPHQCYAPTLNILADLLAEAHAALAAGVGVSPDADSGCAPAKERQDARCHHNVHCFEWGDESPNLGGGRHVCDCGAIEIDRAVNFAGRVAHVASGASAAEGRKPETPAGVGEARPADEDKDG